MQRTVYMRKVYLQHKMLQLLISEKWRLVRTVGRAAYCLAYRQSETHMLPSVINSNN